MGGDQLHGLGCEDRGALVSSHSQTVVNVLGDIYIGEGQATGNNCQTLAELLQAWRRQGVSEMRLAGHDNLNELRLMCLEI
jgi:5,10-methenyltetrahydromethanopterin hydrogenase